MIQALKSVGQLIWKPIAQTVAKVLPAAEHAAPKLSADALHFAKNAKGIPSKVVNMVPGGPEMQKGAAQVLKGLGQRVTPIARKPGITDLQFTNAQMMRKSAGVYNMTKGTQAVKAGGKELAGKLPGVEQLQAGRTQLSKGVQQMKTPLPRKPGITDAQYQNAQTMHHAAGIYNRTKGIQKITAGGAKIALTGAGVLAVTGAGLSIASNKGDNKNTQTAANKPQADSKQPVIADGALQAQYDAANAKKPVSANENPAITPNESEKQHDAANPPVVEQDVQPNPPEIDSRPVANEASTSGQTYQVRKGDTLWDIAKTHMQDARKWGAIAELNGITNPRQIKPGQVIHLP